MKKIISLFLLFFVFFSFNSQVFSQENLTNKSNENDHFSIFAKSAQAKDIDSFCIEMKINKNKDNSKGWSDVFDEFISCLRVYQVGANHDVISFEKIYNLTEKIYSIKAGGNDCFEGGLHLSIGANKWPSSKLKEELKANDLCIKEDKAQSQVERFENVFSNKMSQDEMETFLKNNKSENIQNFSVAIKFSKDKQEADLKAWEKLYNLFVEHTNYCRNADEKDLTILKKIDDLVKSFDKIIKSEESSSIKSQVAVFIDTKNS